MNEAKLIFVIDAIRNNALGTDCAVCEIQDFEASGLGGYMRLHGVSLIHADFEEKNRNSTVKLHSAPYRLLRLALLNKVFAGLIAGSAREGVYGQSGIVAVAGRRSADIRNDMIRATGQKRVVIKLAYDSRGNGVFAMRRYQIPRLLSLLTEREKLNQKSTQKGMSRGARLRYKIRAAAFGIRKKYWLARGLITEGQLASWTMRHANKGLSLHALDTLTIDPNGAPLSVFVQRFQPGIVTRQEESLNLLGVKNKKPDSSNVRKPTTRLVCEVTFVEGEKPALALVNYNGKAVAYDKCSDVAKGIFSQRPWKSDADFSALLPAHVAQNMLDAIKEPLARFFENALLADKDPVAFVKQCLRSDDRGTQLASVELLEFIDGRESRAHTDLAEELFRILPLHSAPAQQRIIRMAFEHSLTQVSPSKESFANLIAALPSIYFDKQKSMATDFLAVTRFVDNYVRAGETIETDQARKLCVFGMTHLLPQEGMNTLLAAQFFTQFFEKTAYEPDAILSQSDRAGMQNNMETFSIAFIREPFEETRLGRFLMDNADTEALRPGYAQEGMGLCAAARRFRAGVRAVFMPR